MKKLIIIPAYNESSNIVNTIRTIESDAPDFDYIIIDDCSTDNTLAICQKQGFNVISLPINLGIGGAVQTGYRYAQRCGYDVAVQVDGDGQHNPCYLEKMVEVLVQSSVNM
ncbi:TPA: glycosyltransferase family 2 protein, partial [Streptococcus pyogenes]